MAKPSNAIILDSTGQAIKDAILRVASAINLQDGVIYGFHVNGAESDPEAAVSYLKDAQGMSPAFMDYTKGIFNYGSWQDAFFMPRPCMLKSDGTVDYYLDPNDYTKKAEGGASDVANTSYDGNAMMEWPKIWTKIVPDANPKSGSVYIADHQVDGTYTDYPYHNANGVSMEHFYTPIYNGSVISSKMRSLSGQALSKTVTTTNQRTYAKANNPAGSAIMWDIECFADRQLINFLLILIGKSLNTQKVFGEGATVSGSEAINDTFLTGIHNTKGLFFGTNSGTVAANSFNNCVKVFGMENWWGMQYRRTVGLMLVSGVEKFKLTRSTEDGTTVSDYNEDGTGYVSSGVTPSGTSGGYVSEGAFSEKGMFSKVASGSATTYLCDGLWYNADGAHLALFGGNSSRASRAGAFCLYLDVAASDAYWSYGAALSCKPLRS